MILVSLFITYYLVRPKVVEAHYAEAYGEIIAFRGDLNKAVNVPVYPSEQAVWNQILTIGNGSIVKNITIAFKDAGESENPYYIIQEIELHNKIGFLFLKKYDFIPGFKAIEVESYENLPGLIQAPIIAIVHPEFSNETAIRVDGHVILLKAKTHEDMDLVTAKLFIILFDLKPIENK